MQLTTSLKIPPDLKKRVAALARREGKSVHAFLIETIARRAAALESREEFIAGALASREQFLRTGKGYAARGVHAWLRARAAGKKARRPKARTWRK